jgi:hypothetical protein
MSEEDEVVSAVVKEAERIEEDALFSAKRHFNAAAIWNNTHLLLGLPTALIAGVSGISALSHHTLIAGVLSLTVAGLTALTTFLNPSQRATNHHDFGNRYNALRNKTRILREIDVHDSHPTELVKELKALNRERDELNQKAPQTPRLAFIRARAGIEEGEAQYKADKPSNG